jgi:uncharacterized protein YbjT (DUF2867 family)
MRITASVVGATGLVGKEVVAQLCNDAGIDAVHLLARRPLADAAIAGNPKLIQHVIDFGQLPHVAWPHSDVLFCCLGTTIKTAGSQAAFRTVDFDYVVESARQARQAGASRLIVVSSLGANARSGVFYNRVKGEMEAAVMALGFDATTLIRPSFLTGERAESRPGERFALSALKIGNLFLPAKYRAVSAIAVARAMIAAAKNNSSGMIVIESEQIQNFS